MAQRTDPRHLSRPTIVKPTRDRSPYDRATNDLAAVSYTNREQTPQRRLVVPVMPLHERLRVLNAQRHDLQTHPYSGPGSVLCDRKRRSTGV
jgi:hypothetical protein